MEIRFTPLASSDLEAIGDYIAQNNQARVYSFVLEIRNQCRKIASSPMSYKCRPEFGQGIRSCAFGMQSGMLMDGMTVVNPFSNAGFASISAR